MKVTARLAVAFAAASLVALSGTAGAAARGAQGGETCSATVVAATLAGHLGGPWLHIVGTGYRAGETYAVFATVPNGYVEGVSVYSADGTWETTSLPAPLPGVYPIRVRRLTAAGDRGPVLATCSATAP